MKNIWTLQIWSVICNFINVYYQAQNILTNLSRSVWSTIELLVCPLASGVKPPMILSYYYANVWTLQIWWMICNFINVPYQDQYILTKLCRSVWTTIELFVCPLTSGVNPPKILSYYYSSKKDAALNEMRWYCRLTHIHVIQVGDPVLHQDLLFLALVGVNLWEDWDEHLNDWFSCCWDLVALKKELLVWRRLFLYQIKDAVVLQTFDEVLWFRPKMIFNYFVPALISNKYVYMHCTFFSWTSWCIMCSNKSFPQGFRHVTNWTVQNNAQAPIHNGDNDDERHAESTSSEKSRNI